MNRMKRSVCAVMMVVPLLFCAGPIFLSYAIPYAMETEPGKNCPNETLPVLTAAAGAAVSGPDQ